MTLRALSPSIDNMVELSLHILDIVKNSTKAGASLVTVEINESIARNELEIIITDNGCGMDEEFLKNVTDPFKTTRTTRKVGMGLSLFKSAALLTGGDFDIKSKKGEGTVVKAIFVHNSIDRQPLGDMASTFVTLISGNENTDFVYRHNFEDEVFEFSTIEIKKIIGDISISSPEIIGWITGYIEEGLQEIYK